MDKEKKQRVKAELLSWGKTLAFALGLALAFNNFIVVNASIPSGSMETTVNTGDRVMCSRMAYLNSDPERFDIIVFRNHNGDDPKHLFKRVIGLPGELLEIREGKVYIDGAEEPLRDDFVSGDPIGYYGPCVIPENCYFVMGDKPIAWLRKHRFR